MSEIEQNSPLVQEIKEIYIFLTEKEPTPDEEIEAREKLIDKFTQLKNNNDFPNNKELVSQILGKLKDWDTLDYWFIETDIPQNFKRLLQLYESKGKIEEEIATKNDIEEKLEGEKEVRVSRDAKEGSKPTKEGLLVSTPEEMVNKELKKEVESQIEKETQKNTGNLDISDIVAQVSEQFKGQIDNLKEQIGTLQKELEKKEKSINNTAEKKTVRKITPRKDVKLPPPKIHLPAIKKSAVKTKESNKESKPKQEKKVLEEKKEVIKAKIESKKDDTEEKKIEIDKPDLSKIPSKTVEIKSSQLAKGKEVIKEEDKKPKVKIPLKKEESETGGPSKFVDFSDESEQGVTASPINDLAEDKSSEEGTVNIKGQELRPIPTELPKKEEITMKEEKDSIKAPPPPKKPQISKEPPKPPQKLIEKQNKTKSESSIPQKPSITTMAIEEPTVLDKTKKKSIEAPKIKEKKGIAEVNVEEIESAEIKSKGTDLFNMFSSMGKKGTPENTPKKSTSSISPFLPQGDKYTNKDTTKVKPKAKTTPSPPEKPKESELKPIDELPQDKDALYQELIALEGKRYSLEKDFKQIEGSYQKGSIDEGDFKNKSENLKQKLNEITTRITNIRRIIASM
ncbi:MAG: hypothetical protein GF317_00510 [Candidatus Lokiarchaeota archaeon]|nr:hypothetical protein [Candidatus Lokiarchaeota archaeon]MBD3198458.1 hypothetical protein [Candidatus Lokiarchaeota archaeon]